MDSYKQAEEGKEEGNAVTRCRLPWQRAPQASLYRLPPSGTRHAVKLTDWLSGPSCAVRIII